MKCDLLDIQIRVTTPFTDYPLSAPTEMPDRKFTYLVYIDNFEKFNQDLLVLIAEHTPKYKKES